MGLQFKENRNEVIELDENFDMSDKKYELESALKNSKEVDDIVSTIDVYDPQTIVSFGSDAAQNVSNTSDVILNSIDIDKINDSGQLLSTLGRIMDKFDVKEISDTEEKKGFIGKIFNNVNKQLDQIIAKYHSMGEEVDKIYVQLKQYESEINDSNQKLNSLFETNLDYYQQLVKYIIAGEQGIQEIDEYVTNLKNQYESNPDNILQIDISTLEQAKEILEQRVQDLRMAESIAMQSIPMIKSMQMGNINLIRKINSAFIITLPIFKQSLTQAVLLKRQHIQSKAMQVLDEKTNEMLVKNAKNTVEQAKVTANLMSSSVKIETLEKTWNTIVSGIQETQEIEQQARQKREEDVKRLNKIREDFKTKMNV